MKLLIIFAAIGGLVGFALIWVGILLVLKGSGYHVGQEIGWSLGYAILVGSFSAWLAAIMPPPGREDWLKSH